VAHIFLHRWSVAGFPHRNAHPLPLMEVASL
jgi:hypothetical protein